MSEPFPPPAGPSAVPAGLPVPPPPPRPKRNVLLLVGLFLGVPLVLCLGIAALGALFVGTAKKMPLQPGDREALVTAGDLLAAAGNDAEVDASKEKLGRERFIDGSVDLTYEYEQDDPPMYVMTTVTVEKNAQDARTTFLTSSAGGSIGIALSGEKNVELEDRPGLLSWGDQSKTQVMTGDGRPAGNFIVVRKGDRVFMAMFAGVYFDEKETLETMLVPRLEAMMQVQR